MPTPHLHHSPDVQDAERRRVLAGLGALGLALGTGSASVAAQQLPPGTVTLIVGYGTGSTFDLLARALADLVSSRLGRPVVVENRTGAAGAVGNAYVAKAKPDGATLVIGGAGSHGVTPAVKRNLPYDTARDFTAIAGIATYPSVLVVPRTLPVNTLGEFIAYARRNPGKIDFGSTGVGTSLHLSMELFKRKAGIDITNVPYRDNGTMKTDLVAGRLHLSIDTVPSLISLIEQGALRPLAVTSGKRAEKLPNVPTMKEAGIDDLVVESWVGVYGPRGMDPAVVQLLSKAFTDSALSDVGRSRLAALGAEVAAHGSERFDALWRADMRRWVEVVKAAGITPEDLAN